ncbi:protein-L-isoaspartate(D-aspartate) O-methyltransferase [Desulfovermiculus halophilus]|jgi:protein-L-isoaspartate(D-aspartate) O-methyltransferase|uniref:protein-L-isoaspartate(D-aspartate) O-methyltransferase n=1 Tax=Desulfovermiculus halophilus TaxID=339722 RepID=UPI0009FFA678|nr:protein-L-isoaspartate(D-aspartate) O-methyltransferase [Desulfovermiculus halophilus]
MNPQGEDPYLEARMGMVERQIKARGVTNPLVIKAMQEVPRHEFVPEPDRRLAYADRPLPIGRGQTISQPYIVAYMTELLRLCGGENVLEIGTGCGYQAAVLSRIARTVYSIEVYPELADRARDNLRRLGYDSIEIICGDGTMGWPEHAPYDGIIATASGPDVPDPLKEQLAMGGKLVMPVGEYRFGQYITRVTKGKGDHFNQERLLDVAFVPLIGKHGWPK